ncbi:MAG: hypothetical protein H0T42_04510, partial [Deltaproteobacteria bacterium]|nr:hypothetical protein [Deltaproteobacteria bacterium]
LSKVLADEGMASAGVNPNELKKERAPGVAVDPVQVKKLTQTKDTKLAASAILAATDRWGTDEAAVSNALKGKTPGEIEAIKIAFKEHSGGKDLDDVLEEEMEGTALKEAKALMSGDPVQAAVAQLHNASAGLGTDKDKIQVTLKEVTDPQLRKQVKEQYEKQTGQSLDAMLQDELSGFDKDKAKAYLGGNNAEIAAVNADAAMHGGFLTNIADGLADTAGIDRKVVRNTVGGSVSAVVMGPLAPLAGSVFGKKIGTDFGTDNKALYEALESCKDEKERQALKDEYKKRTGNDLMVDVNADLEGKEKDVARFIMAGDKPSAEAAKMAAAADGLGTDKKAIYEALEKAQSKAERDALIKKYNELYGKNGETFDKMLEGELDQLDLAKAKQLEKSGKMDDGFALYYAMNEGLWGIGTDDQLLKERLKGKSKEEIAKLQADYARAAKEQGVENANLAEDVTGETSGRDGHELKQALKGNPTTVEEMRQRAKEDYAFERTESSWVGDTGMLVVMGPFGYAAAKSMGVEPTDLANGLTDSWSGTGKRLDQTDKEIEAKYAQIKADPKYANYENLPIGSPERAAMDKAMMADLQGVADWQEGDLKGFQEAKDATADVAGTAVAIAVGAVITLASGGTAAPAVVALLSGIAGVGTKMLIRGGSMSNEEIVTAVASVIAEACAAGFVKLETINTFIEKLGALAGASNKIIGSIVQEALEEAIESGSEELLNAMLDPALYKGDLADWAKGVSQRTGKAIFTGGVTGGVSGGLGEIVPVPTSWQGRTLKAGANQAAGSVVAQALDPNSFEGSVEEKWTKFGRAVGEASLRGMRDSVGGGNAGSGKVDASANATTDSDVDTKADASKTAITAATTTAAATSDTAPQLNSDGGPIQTTTAAASTTTTTSQDPGQIQDPNATNATQEPSAKADLDRVAAEQNAARAQAQVEADARAVAEARADAERVAAAAAAVVAEQEAAAWAEQRRQLESEKQAAEDQAWALNNADRKTAAAEAEAQKKSDEATAWDARRDALAVDKRAQEDAMWAGDPAAAARQKQIEIDRAYAELAAAKKLEQTTLDARRKLEEAEAYEAKAREDAQAQADADAIKQAQQDQMWAAHEPSQSATTDATKPRGPSATFHGIEPGSVPANATDTQKAAFEEANRIYDRLAQASEKGGAQVSDGYAYAQWVHTLENLGITVDSGNDESLRATLQGVASPIPADIARLLQRATGQELVDKALTPDRYGSLATPQGLQDAAEAGPVPDGMIRLIDGSLAPAMERLSPEARDWLAQQRAQNAELAGSPRKVVVDGGGPTGALAALQAFLAGHDVTIVEQREGATLPILWNNRPETRQILEAIDPVLAARMYDGENAGAIKFYESVDQQGHREQTLLTPASDPDADRATGDPRTIAAQSSAYQTQNKTEVNLIWDRLTELATAEAAAAEREGRPARLNLLRGYEVKAMPADGQRRSVVVQKVVQVIQQVGADGKPVLDADGRPTVLPYTEGMEIPEGYGRKPVRQTDGVDVNLGTPDDLLVADGAGSKGRRMVGAESLPVGPSADYIAGYFEGAPLRTQDADGNTLQGGSRFHVDTDAQGNPLHTAVGTGAHTDGTWALPQVDPSLDFKDPVSIEAYFGRPMSAREATLTYYKQQVAQVLEVDPALIRDDAFVFGPAAFTVQSNVSSPVASDASNVHLIGDARGNSHFFASLGKVTGTGTHQMALRQYWQALAWGLNPDVARALLDRRLDAGTRVWLKSGLPSFNDPSRPGSMIGDVDAAPAPDAVATDATAGENNASPMLDGGVSSEATSDAATNANKPSAASTVATDTTPTATTETTPAATTETTPAAAEIMTPEQLAVLDRRAITKASQLMKRNVPVGIRTPDRALVESVLGRLVAGDKTALAEIGMQGRPDHSLIPDQVEWAIGRVQTETGPEYILIKGTRSEIDISDIPGVELVAHNHPREFDNKLVAAPDGSMKIADLAATDSGYIALFPSAADLAYCTDHGQPAHTVFLPYRHLGDGVLANAEGGGKDTGDPVSVRFANPRAIAGTDPTRWTADVEWYAGGQLLHSEKLITAFRTDGTSERFASEGANTTSDLAADTTQVAPTPGSPERTPFDPATPKAESATETATPKAESTTETATTETTTKINTETRTETPAAQTPAIDSTSVDDSRVAAVRSGRNRAEGADAQELVAIVQKLKTTFGSDIEKFDTQLVPGPSDRPLLQQSPSDALIGLPTQTIPATMTAETAVTMMAERGIPRWGALTTKERAHETAFASQLEADLPGAVDQFFGMSLRDGVYQFEVDGAKKLYAKYGKDKAPQGDEQLDVRATANHAMHPAAVAVARLAFLRALDQMQALPDNHPKKSVFVTNGGCASGKGSLTSIVRDQAGGNFNFGAVWDAAGEGDAAENGWILEAAQARGIKVTFGFVESDPMLTYNGVLERAKGTGRIVDPVTFTRSYVRGQKNMRAFLESPEYQKAVADGEVDAIGVYTGRFDMAKNSFPDKRMLGREGHIQASDIKHLAHEGEVTGKAIELFEQWLKKEASEGRRIDHWLEGGAVNPLKFDPNTGAQTAPTTDGNPQLAEQKNAVDPQQAADSHLRPEQKTS